MVFVFQVGYGCAVLLRPAYCGCLLLGSMLVGCWLALGAVSYDGSSCMCSLDCEQEGICGCQCAVRVCRRSLMPFSHRRAACARPMGVVAQIIWCIVLWRISDNDDNVMRVYVAT